MHFYTSQGSNLTQEPATTALGWQPMKHVNILSLIKFNLLNT